MIEIISYLILAPTVIPKSFVDARQITEKLVKAIHVDEQEYCLGSTKVSIIFECFAYGIIEFWNFGIIDLLKIMDTTTMTTTTTTTT